MSRVHNKGPFKGFFFNPSKSRKQVVASTVGLRNEPTAWSSLEVKISCHGDGGSDGNGDDNRAVAVVTVMVMAG